MQNGPWQVVNVRKAKFDWDIVPFPAGPAGSTPRVSGSGFAIPGRRRRCRSRAGLDPAQDAHQHRRARTSTPRPVATTRPGSAPASAFQPPPANLGIVQQILAGKIAGGHPFDVTTNWNQVKQMLGQDLPRGFLGQVTVGRGDRRPDPAARRPDDASTRTTCASPPPAAGLKEGNVAVQTVPSTDRPPHRPAHPTDAGAGATVRPARRGCSCCRASSGSWSSPPGPVVAAGVISLLDWNLFSPPTFAGLNNFWRLGGDPTFWSALVNTAYFTLASVPLTIVVSLALALLLNRGPAAGRGVPLAPAAALRHHHGGRRVRLDLALHPARRAGQRRARAGRHRRAGLAHLRHLGDARADPDERVEGLRLRDGGVPRRAAGHPAAALRGRAGGRQQPVAELPATSPCRCSRRRSSS